MEQIFKKLNRYFCGKWRLAVLDLELGRWITEPKESNIPYLKAQNAHGRHILMQPDPLLEPYYLLVDDLSWSVIEGQHQYGDRTWKPGRMVVETSRNNYQVWIHSCRFLSLNEKRYWLQKLHGDPGADPHHRWGRCPGFCNRKDKYRDHKGSYPLARLLWIDWKRQASIPHLHLESSLKPSLSSSPSTPRGGVCRPKNISRLDYARGDESATDFSYAMALVRRGYPDHEIRKRILSERTNWKNHQGQRRINQYLDRTINRARAIVERT